MAAFLRHGEKGGDAAVKCLSVVTRVGVVNLGPGDDQGLSIT